MSIYGVVSSSTTLPYIGFDEPGYTMLDYIDTSGSQYLDTSFAFTSGTLDIILTVDFSEVTSERDVISTFTTANGFSVGVYLRNGTTPYAFNYVVDSDNALAKLPTSSGIMTLYAQITDTTHAISLDGVNWDVATHGAGRAYKSDVVLVGGSVYHTNKHYLNEDKIIRVQMYHDGELVRDYVPSKNTSNNNIGLFDLVNENQITNQGTGADFTPGNIVVESEYKSIVNASKDVTQLDYDLAECEDGWFSRYTRVEYITQNGTGARIDTGIQFKDIGYMDLDFQYDVANFTCVCGGATGGSNNYVCWYSNQLHEGHGGNVIDSGNDRIIGHRYRFISKQGTNASIAYRDGEFLKNYTSQLFSNSTAIMGLFAFGGGGYSGGTQRIYYVEFRRSEDGEVLRKFIPCIRKSDSKSGMYDMVTKQFFEGIGETFYPSSKEYHFDYQKYHMYCAKPIYQIDIDIADKVDGWFGDYIRCDYIENQSKAYIDTGFSAPNGFKSQMGLYFYEIGDTGSRALPIIGAHEPSSPYGRNDMIIRPYFEMGAGDVYVTDYYVQPDTYYEIDFSTVKGDLYVVDHTLTRSYGGDDSRSSRNLYLFDVNGYNFANKLKFRMYYCKIYNDNNELVRDYIPCIRRSDLKAGLYDLIGKEFYTSSNGYDFIPGGRQYEFNFIKY